jgi:hypothetical protein
MGVELQPHVFLTWAVGGGKWSAAPLGRYTPRVRASFTHLMESRWPSLSVGILWRKDLARNRTPIPQPFSPYLVGAPTELSWTLKLMLKSTTL